MNEVFRFRDDIFLSRHETDGRRLRRIDAQRAQPTPPDPPLEDLLGFTMNVTTPAPTSARPTEATTPRRSGHLRRAVRATILALASFATVGSVVLVDAGTASAGRSRNELATEIAAAADEAIVAIDAHAWSETDTTARGRELSERLNPGMEAALRERYEALVPGMAEAVVDFAYGRQYARDGLPLRDRYLATIAALTALGGQTRPQLKVNIRGGRAAGLSRREIGEVIWQMSLYGGFPAAINALNAALEVFDAEEAEHDDG